MSAEQARQRLGRKLAQRILLSEIVHGLLHAPRLAESDDLRAGVADGLEQDWAHIHVRCLAAGEGLQDLRARHLEPVAGHAGLVGHVLGLEGRDIEPRIREQPAEADGYQALAHVRSRAEDRNRARHRKNFLAGPSHEDSVCVQ